MARPGQQRRTVKNQAHHPKKNQARSEKKGLPKATFDIETLEPRILLSGTWVDADTGDPLAGATEGNDTYSKSSYGYSCSCCNGGECY